MLAQSEIEAATGHSPGRSGEAEKVLREVAHRPLPIPRRPWAMQQRWNNLLFAHWPMPAATVEATLPPGLVVDTFDGSAWLGIVPFGMDRIHLRGLPSVPGARAFPELNLRTYVRERGTNRTGVYFYSLDASNPLAVSVARAVFHLPYFWASMRMRVSEEPGCSPQVEYTSRRLLTRHSAHFRAHYRGLGRMAQGPIEQFLTARYALYTATGSGRLLRGDIHHMPWPLEHAEAEFEVNRLPAAHGFRLPDTAPVLHYSRELLVYVWTLERAGGYRLAAAAARPASAGTAAVSRQE